MVGSSLSSSSVSSLLRLFDVLKSASGDDYRFERVCLLMQQCQCLLVHLFAAVKVNEFAKFLRMAKQISQRHD